MYLVNVVREILVYIRSMNRVILWNEIYFVKTTFMLLGVFTWIIVNLYLTHWRNKMKRPRYNDLLKKEVDYFFELKA